MEVVNENGNNVSKQESKRILSGVLAIFLGSLGVHKFILGYTMEGLIMLIGSFVVGFITCGIGFGIFGTIGLIEGIIYLTKSDEEFVETYQTNKKAWF